MIFDKLFGNKNTEHVLFYLLKNKSCYAFGLAKQCGGAVNGFQQALKRLELAGVIVSSLQGKTRVYEFNPRYLFLNELKALISTAYKTIPLPICQKKYEPLLRTRPRRPGKPLN